MMVTVICVQYLLRVNAFTDKSVNYILKSGQMGYLCPVLFPLCQTVI